MRNDNLDITPPIPSPFRGRVYRLLFRKGGLVMRDWKVPPIGVLSEFFILP
jgi:hypothetical protein